MTQLVGIYCTNGVVIATDSAATFGAVGVKTIGQQPIQKLYPICGNIIYTGSGAVGIAQIIAGDIRDKWTDGKFKSFATPEQAMHAIGTRIGQLVAPFFQLAQIQRQLVGDVDSALTKSMIAFPVKKKPYLFTFDFNGAPEMATVKLPFVTLGSGQPIADPFLAFLARLLWPDRQPTLAEGRLTAAWTIDHVRRTNPGGVGGSTCMAILEENHGNLPKVSELTDADIEEHKQSIESAEKAILKELNPPASDTSVRDLPLPPAPNRLGPQKR